MEIDIATKKDIEQLRQEILTALASYFAKQPAESKTFLRSKEVRKILNISSGTLQNLRVTGKLTGTKVNGLWYYRYDDIQSLLNAGNE